MSREELAGVLGRAPPSRASRNLESSHDLPRSPTISPRSGELRGGTALDHKGVRIGRGPKGRVRRRLAAQLDGLSERIAPVHPSSEGMPSSARARPTRPTRPIRPTRPTHPTRRSRRTRTDASWRRVERHAAQRTAQRFDTQQLAEIRIDILAEMIVARQHAAATPPAAVGAPPETAVRVASVSGQRIIVKPHLCD